MVDYVALLPAEVWAAILQYVDVRSCARLRRACRALKVIASDNSYWRPRLLRKLAERGVDKQQIEDLGRLFKPGGGGGGGEQNDSEIVQQHEQRKAVHLQQQQQQQQPAQQRQLSAFAAYPSCLVLQVYEAILSYAQSYAAHDGFQLEIAFYTGLGSTWLRAQVRGETFLMLSSPLNWLSLRGACRVQRAGKYVVVWRMFVDTRQRLQPLDFCIHQNNRQVMRQVMPTWLQQTTSRSGVFHAVCGPVELDRGVVGFSVENCDTLWLKSGYAFSLVYVVPADLTVIFKNPMLLGHIPFTSAD